MTKGDQIRRVATLQIEIFDLRGICLLLIKSIREYYYNFFAEKMQKCLLLTLEKSYIFSGSYLYNGW